MGFKLVRIDATEPCKIPLPVGTHLIGRGKFLDCSDHRVSRMHGQLKVTDDAVTITALHQNPCFFRKKDIPTIHVLPLNNFIDLNNGDQFGLIPDSFWFEVIYCINNVEGPGAVVSPFTRLVKEGEITQPSGSSSNEATARPVSQDTTAKDSQETIISDQYQYPSPSKRPHSETQPYSIKKPKIEPSSPATDQNRPNVMDSPSILNQNSSQNENQSENDQTPSDNDQNPTEDVQNPTEDDQNEENTEEVSYNDQISKENTQPISSKQNIPENVESSSNIKPKEESNNDDSESSSDESNPPANVKQEVKKEPNTPDNVKPGPSQDQQVNQIPAADGAGPAQGNNGRPREKCMYGASCYRVNPVHKAQFSHPGDSDWDAVRVCPNGANCRDHRPAHWRDNQHPAPHRGNHLGNIHRRPGIRVVQRHGNIYYINAHSVYFYDDYLQVHDSDGESVDYDYEF